MSAPENLFLNQKYELNQMVKRVSVAPMMNGMTFKIKQ